MNTNRYNPSNPLLHLFKNNFVKGNLANYLMVSNKKGYSAYRDQIESNYSTMIGQAPEFASSMMEAAGRDSEYCKIARTAADGKIFEVPCPITYLDDSDTTGLVIECIRNYLATFLRNQAITLNRRIELRKGSPIMDYSLNSFETEDGALPSPSVRILESDLHPHIDLSISTRTMDFIGGIINYGSGEGSKSLFDIVALSKIRNDVETIDRFFTRKEPVIDIYFQRDLDAMGVRLWKEFKSLLFVDQQDLSNRLELFQDNFNPEMDAYVSMISKCILTKDGIDRSRSLYEALNNIWYIIGENNDDIQYFNKHVWKTDLILASLGEIIPYMAAFIRGNPSSIILHTLENICTMADIRNHLQDLEDSL